MKFKGEEVRSFDLKDEVDSWKKVHSVNFCENPKEKENNQEIRKKERHMEEKGVRAMFYTRNNLGGRTEVERGPGHKSPRKIPQLK